MCSLLSKSAFDANIRNCKILKDCFKVCMSSYSSKSDPFQDPGYPRVALSQDRTTIAMYHPKKTTAYEDTVPIPRDDKRYAAYTTANEIAEERLYTIERANHPVESRAEHFFPMRDRDIPGTANELGQIFYTSKHRWFYTRRAKPWFSEYDEADRPQK